MMMRVTQRYSYTGVLVAAAAFAFGALVVFNVAFGYRFWLVWQAVPLAVIGIALTTVRPSVITSYRLPLTARLGTIATTVVATGAIAWATLVVVTQGGNDTLEWLLVALGGVALAATIGGISRIAAWMPAAASGLLVTGALIALVAGGAWAATCPDCGIREGHDPASRALIFSGWTFAVGVASAGYIAILATFTHAARLLSPPTSTQP